MVISGTTEEMMLFDGAEAQITTFTSQQPVKTDQ